jgi:hypothetical protein
LQGWKNNRKSNCGQSEACAEVSTFAEFYLRRQKAGAPYVTQPVAKEKLDMHCEMP